MLGLDDKKSAPNSGATDSNDKPMPLTTIPSIPESAPFTPEQRAWLNGFLAAWAGVAEQQGSRLPSEVNGLDDAPAAFSNGAPKKSAAKPAPAPAAAEAGPALAPPQDDGDYPWHDPNLDLEERMKLAEGQNVTGKLMAAMAQLDCGACGYMCDTYAMAIAAGKEKSTALCTPGGRDTAKMLKQVVKDAGGIKPAAKSDLGAISLQTPVSNDPIPYSRAKPFRARVGKLYNLNQEGSAKHTCHVELDLTGSDISFRVGDSLGAFPTNCPDLVDEILFALKAHGTEHVTAADGVEAQLREALSVKSNLKLVDEDLVRLIASSTSDFEEKQRLRELIDSDSDELDDMDVLDVLRLAPSARISKSAFALTLGSLSPRLYSIASSLRAHPDAVHLTVAKVTTEIGGRVRKGVASTMFTERVEVGDTVRVFVQPSADFTLPSNANAPMIMVGPGTGIAPFRAFLQERRALKARGKNWLFFGDQHEKSDFLYGDELRAMQEEGLLTRLSTAFSRDQEEKIYVQHRMQQEGAELFAWLEEGAWFFVCGDAKRMAGDVDRTLHAIVAEHGGMSEEDAKKYVTKLRKSHRYVRDVY
jgi:sulfite reductase (NADPH) flavoprotein alpha-component